MKTESRPAIPAMLLVLAGIFLLALPLWGSSVEAFSCPVRFYSPCRLRRRWQCFGALSRQWPLLLRSRRQWLCSPSSLWRWIPKLLSLGAVSCWSCSSPRCWQHTSAAIGGAPSVVPMRMPNPSLHPKCDRWLRHLSPSGELKR
jgi:hypothetical protein